jgi:hypothetical protein
MKLPKQNWFVKYGNSDLLAIYYYILHSHILEPVTSAKYLGVTLQSNLKWNTHIDIITSNGNKTLGYLKRNLQILNLEENYSNRKISVNMMKLPKQNWFVKYGNSDLLAIYFKYISVTSAYLTHNSIKEPE